MKNFMAGLVMAAFAAISYAQTGLQYPDEMIAAAISGDEAKVLETKAHADLVEKPQRGDRKSARALNTKGLADISAGNFDSAIEALSKAGQVDPLDAEIPSNLGYAYLKQGAYEQAKRALAQSISLQPGRGSAWATLAEAFARSGDIEKATACFNIAYTFSQNRDKTKEFLSKIVAENADAKLTTAAKAALEAEGIKPLKREVQAPTVQQPKPIAEPNSSSAPVAAAPAQEAITPTPKTKSEPVRQSTESGGNAGAAPTNYVKVFVGGVLLAILAVSVFFGYRKIKQVRVKTSGDESASNQKYGGLKKAFIGLVMLGVAFRIGNFLVGEKQLPVSKENLAGSYWNCSSDRSETHLLMFPIEGVPGTLVNRQTPDGKIIQMYSSFDNYSIDGNVVSLKSKGILWRGRKANESDFVNLRVDHDSTFYKAEVPFLTAQGMIISFGKGYGWRACNRVEPKVFATLALGMDGMLGDRKGLPDVSKVLGPNANQPAAESSKTSTGTSNSDKTLLARAEEFDVQAFGQLLKIAKRNGNPQCGDIAEDAAKQLAEDARQYSQAEFKGERDAASHFIRLTISQSLPNLKALRCFD